MTTVKKYLTGLILGLAACQTPVSDAVPTAPPAPPQDMALFVRRNGQQLVQNGQPVQLNGVAFGNWVWNNSGTPPTLHHNEQDFARLREMNLNCIRFYLNYAYFESDATPYTYKASGWDWLDQQVSWAKKHGISLILNMHVPQGGYQSQGNGAALWNVPENQKRLTALWRAIAQRYRNEPTVAGYDLLNEPVTPRSIDQWKDLAQGITAAIRAVDQAHLIVVERLNAVGTEWKDVNGERNMFLLQDDNVLYEFHTYDPFEYTHQTFDWAGRVATEREQYPDETRISSPPDAAWYTAIFTNPVVPAGTSGWAFYEGVRYAATDPALKIGVAVYQTANLGTGKAFLDQLTVSEYDPQNRLVSRVVQPGTATTTGWWLWSKANTGTFVAGPGGRTGNALTVSGTTDDANISFGQQKFRITTGNSYQVSGWLRGENIPATANVRLRVDFETTSQPITARNKTFLRESVRFYADWGRKNNVPTYLGEYGAGSPCFRPGLGGLIYVSDMIDICREFGFHTTYHSYHEDSFGWYYGHTSLPDIANANGPLVDLFRQKFAK